MICAQQGSRRFPDLPPPPPPHRVFVRMYDMIRRLGFRKVQLSRHGPSRLSLRLQPVDHSRKEPVPRSQRLATRRQVCTVCCCEVTRPRLRRTRRQFSLKTPCSGACSLDLWFEARHGRSSPAIGCIGECAGRVFRWPHFLPFFFSLFWLVCLFIVCPTTGFSDLCFPLLVCWCLF